MAKDTEILAPMREKIDALDAQIVDLLVKRLALVREVAKLKSKHGLPAVIEERIREVIDRAGDLAGEEDEDFVREIYALIIVIACDLEEEVMGIKKDK
jgi:chorismate mutase